MSDEGPLKVVLGVDVLIRGIYREDERAVLALWRDGLLRPVLHRPLLLRTLAALTRLGLDEPVLRCWIVWLTAPERSLAVAGAVDGMDGMDQGAGGWPDLYREGARLGEAKVVVTGAPKPTATPGEEAPGLLWLAPAEFLKQAGREGMK